MTLLVVPMVLWATHGLLHRAEDIWRTTKPALVSAAVAAAFSYAVRTGFESSLAPLPRLVLEGGTLGVTYLGMLYGSWTRRTSTTT